jgi:Lon protease-like protein
MVADVMAGDGRFGLIYHDPDETGPFLSEVGRVGTVAMIKRQQPLPDGRSMILVQGEDRFAIHQEVESENPYYEAEVGEYLDHPPESMEALLARRKRTLALFQNILQTLPHPPDSLPSFRIKRELSFRLAGLVRMEAFWQQELLEMRDEVARLGRLDPVFQAGIEKWWTGSGNEA